jgi:hypothetical protein
VPDGSAENAKLPTDEDRERYLRLLDNALDRGLLDVEEHARRVLDVGTANSIDELNGIVWQLPVMERPAAQRPSRVVSSGQRRRPQAAPLSAVMGTSPGPESAGPVFADLSRSPDLSGPPDFSGPPDSHALPDASVLSAAHPDGTRMLDPVDVAILQMRREAKKPEPTRRWAALIAVAVMFLILIVLGVVLAAHSHTSSGGNGGLGNPAAPHSTPAGTI